MEGISVKRRDRIERAALADKAATLALAGRLNSLCELLDWSNEPTVEASEKALLNELLMAADPGELAHARAIVADDQLGRWHKDFTRGGNKHADVESV